MQIDKEIEEAKQSPEPPLENLWLNIYKDGLHAELRNMAKDQPTIKLPGLH